MMMDKLSSSLPLNAMREIPTPRPDALTIIAVDRQSGVINGYQLSDGRLLSKEEGISLAKQGGIAGVGVGVKYGKEYLKSLPDGTENNNLGNLPGVIR